MKKTLILFAVFILSTCIAAAQSVSGLTKSVAGETLPFATVVLKNAKDSSINKAEVTDENGNFTFENIREGEYFLHVQLIGFQKYTTSVFQVNHAEQLAPFSLELIPTDATLKEVQVAADKPFIERQLDRTVVNVENSIIHSGSSVMEVMEKLPGVLVNQDGVISLKGKQGVIIMIDGKITGLSGQDLGNWLKGMQSSAIQKIEIITNPSSKYDAAGNAGIINIITKKNRQEGFTGSVSGGYGQGRYRKYNGSLNFAYKKNWYNVYLNYNYGDRKGFNNLLITRKFFNQEGLEAVYKTDNYIIFPFKNSAPRLGADFTLTEKTTLSFLATGFSNSITPSADNYSEILNANWEKQNSLYFTNRSKDKWNSYALSSQLKHSMDTTGKEIVVDLDYAHYISNSDQVFTNTVYNSNDQLLGKSIIIGDQEANLTIYAARADYVHPLKNKSILEAGIKSSYVTADSDVKFYNEMESIAMLDTNISNHFLYNENINASYLNFKKELDKVSFQLGLRAEHTLANGHQIIRDQKFKRNYIQLFPTAFMDYKLNKENTFNISAGRRIDRPAYQQMNPFRRLIDATTYDEGNPYLLPQLSYNTELSWIFKNSLFATIGYSTTKNNITDVLTQDAETRITVQKRVNIAQFDYYNFNLNYNKKLFKWWHTNTGLLTFYGFYSGTVNNLTINQGTPSFNLTTSNNFFIKDGLSMEANFFYYHKNLYGVTLIKSTYNLTLGIQKSVFKKQGTVTLNVSDLLWTAYPSGITNFGYVEERWTAKRDTRVVNLNFSYRFGKGKPVKMRRDTGADEEKRRAG